MVAMQRKQKAKLQRRLMRNSLGPGGHHEDQGFCPDRNAESLEGLIRETT